MGRGIFVHGVVYWRCLFSAGVNLTTAGTGESEGVLLIMRVDMNDYLVTSSLTLSAGFQVR